MWLVKLGLTTQFSPLSRICCREWGLLCLPEIFYSIAKAYLSFKIFWAKGKWDKVAVRGEIIKIKEIKHSWNDSETFSQSKHWDGGQQSNNATGQECQEQNSQASLPNSWGKLQVEGQIHKYFPSLLAVRIVTGHMVNCRTGRCLEAWWLVCKISICVTALTKSLKVTEFWLYTSNVHLCIRNLNRLGLICHKLSCFFVNRFEFRKGVLAICVTSSCRRLKEWVDVSSCIIEKNKSMSSYLMGECVK